MKDRNGKRIQKHDVVMCHYPDERFFGKFCVVECDPSIFPDQEHFCITSINTGQRVYSDLPISEYVEIIGDVREEREGAE